MYSSTVRTVLYLVPVRASHLDRADLAKRRPYSHLLFCIWKMKLEQDQQAVVAGALLESVAAGCTFFGGLSSAQLILGVMRISTATPIASSALGALAVGGSAVLAGGSANAVKRLHLPQRLGNVATLSSKNASYAAPDLEEVLCAVLDGMRDATLSKDTALPLAVAGLMGFRFLGARFSAVAPSDFRHPGAFASVRDSLPAKSSYASATERDAIDTIGRRVGCHTCGVRHARFHADHMPPNAVVKRARASLWYRLPFMSIPKQRFFPQCHQCSARQAQAVRTWSKALCFHVGSVRLYHGTGFFVPSVAGQFAKMTAYEWL